MSQQHICIQAVSAELANIATSYAQLVNRNQTIYGPFYVPVLRKALGKTCCKISSLSLGLAVPRAGDRSYVTGSISGLSCSHLA